MRPHGSGKRALVGDGKRRVAQPGGAFHQLFRMRSAAKESEVNFTFLRGASHPEELVKRAAGLGYSALAVTDECSLAGAVRAHVAAKDVGLPLIIGSEIRLQDGPRLVLLATDREGYGNLSELITRGRRRAKKGGYSLCRGDLDGGLPGCLVLLAPGGKHDAEHARCVAERFADRAWIAAELLQGPDDRAQLAALRELGKTY